MTTDYHVHLIQLPSYKIKELVVPNDDGSYTIFIESSLSREEQQKAFLHAVTHIANHDFSKFNVNHIESLAHMKKPLQCYQH